MNFTLLACYWTGTLTGEKLLEEKPVWAGKKGKRERKRLRQKQRLKWEVSSYNWAAEGMDFSCASALLPQVTQWTFPPTNHFLGNTFSPSKTSTLLPAMKGPCGAVAPGSHPQKKQLLIPLVSLSKQSGQYCCQRLNALLPGFQLLLQYTRTLKSRFHFTAPVHLVSRVFWMLKVSQYFPSLLYNTE